MIFPEPIHDPRLVSAVSEQVGGKVLISDPFDGLFEEELARGTGYLQTLRVNLANPVEGLKDG